MRYALLAGCLMAGLATSATAAVVGTEQFGYSDGTNIAGQNGGTGWDFNFQAGTHSVPTSTWENVSNTPSVSGGKLSTWNSAAKRYYSGGQWFEQSVQAAGRIYYAVEMTRDDGADWGGVSSYDFGSERIFWGVPGGQAGAKYFGIDVMGSGGAFSTVEAVAGQKYTLIASLDFDNDLLSLWVNSTVEASPTFTRAYTNSNWSTEVRVGSGGSGQTRWDNLVVATTFNDAVTAIPEPASLALVGLSGLMLMRNRRK